MAHSAMMPAPRCTRARVCGSLGANNARKNAAPAAWYRQINSSARSATAVQSIPVASKRCYGAATVKCTLPAIT